MAVDAYGFIEITGVSAAVSALDIMTKTSDVRFVTWEPSLGGRLCTIIVEGSISAVTEAVEAARKFAIKEPAAFAVMGRPCEEVIKIIERSAKKHKKTSNGRK